MMSKRQRASTLMGAIVNENIYMVRYHIISWKSGMWYVTSLFCDHDV